MLDSKANALRETMFKNSKLNTKLKKESKEFYEKLGFLVDESGKMKQIKNHLRISREKIRNKSTR